MMADTEKAGLSVGGEIELLKAEIKAAEARMETLRFGVRSLGEKIAKGQQYINAITLALAILEAHPVKG
jgi:hypothetical protein